MPAKQNALFLNYVFSTDKLNQNSVLLELKVLHIILNIGGAGLNHDYVFSWIICDFYTRQALRWKSIKTDDTTQIGVHEGLELLLPYSNIEKALTRKNLNFILIFR